MRFLIVFLAGGLAAIWLILAGDLATDLLRQILFLFSILPLGHSVRGAVRALRILRNPAAFQGAVEAFRQDPKASQFQDLPKTSAGELDLKGMRFEVKGVLAWYILVFLVWVAVDVLLIVWSGPTP